MTEQAGLTDGGADLSFEDWIAAIAARTELALDRALPPADEAPAQLHAAMRHGVLDGGKRVRPLLAHAAGLAFAAPLATVEAAAVAVELIHAYSLVHDDMPEMDNDLLRRGKPTVHAAFGQANALLVGDALQSLAFEVLAGADTPRAAQLCALLARAAGSRGMAGGQAIDLASVGLRLSRAELETMHRLKTGALLRASVLLGAQAGAADSRAIDALDAYAAAVGLAFQVVDDILDAEADTATLGKTAGKDAAADKPTYVSLLGLSDAKLLAERLRADAHAALARIDGATLRLAQIADYIVRRSH
ncbi:polyprenyl synthetase family protein [Derxia lacustris]|uniref:polyprenyl synthetase family protein n=1 Tax=Derxia lacustris TaxID=764842 RepID=UPI000A173C2A|nr:farnesyl diphosphate synthase [Derxia lacustris]